MRMQQYLKLEIQNEILRTQNFVKICETAALKDDNQIDEAEKTKAFAKRTTASACGVLDPLRYLQTLASVRPLLLASSL